MDLTDAVHAPEEKALGDRGAEPKSRCHYAPQQATSCCDVYPVAVMPYIAMDVGQQRKSRLKQPQSPIHQPGMQSVCPAPPRRPMWQGVYLLYPQEAMRMPVPVLWIVLGSPKLWERHQRLCPEHCRQLAGSAQQMLSAALDARRT